MTCLFLDWKTCHNSCSLMSESWDKQTMSIVLSFHVSVFPSLPEPFISLLLTVLVCWLFFISTSLPFFLSLSHPVVFWLVCAPLSLTQWSLASCSPLTRGHSDLVARTACIDSLMTDTNGWQGKSCNRMCPSSLQQMHCVHPTADRKMK